MFSRLLVPLDGSRLAETVLPTVQHLALTWDATVLLLHVIERDAPAAVHGDRHLTAMVEAGPYLQELAQDLRAEGIAVETHAHPAPEGDVAQSIVQHCAEEQADLIILCTHGRGRVRDLLFGRIAQQVLRGGSTPVLLLRPPQSDGSPRAEPQSVLVPLDGTASAEAAIPPAIGFARAFRASLHMVMVVPTPETLRGDRHSVGTLLPAATRAELDLESSDAQSYLTEFANRLTAAPKSVPVTTEVCRGDVAAVLADRAAVPNVALVAIATHGRAGLQAVWGGSVAAQILARTRASVFLLRTIDT